MCNLLEELNKHIGKCKLPMLGRIVVFCCLCLRLWGFYHASGKWGGFLVKNRGMPLGANVKKVCGAQAPPSPQGLASIFIPAGVGEPSPLDPLPRSPGPPPPSFPLRSAETPGFANFFQ